MSSIEKETNKSNGPNNNHEKYVKCDKDNTVNPFINDILKNLTFMQKIQVAICSFTVAPIRIILLLTSLLILWPIGIIFANGLTEEDKSVPLKGWRK